MAAFFFLVGEPFGAGFNPAGIADAWLAPSDHAEMPDFIQPPASACAMLIGRPQQGKDKAADFQSDDIHQIAGDRLRNGVTKPVLRSPPVNIVAHQMEFFHHRWRRNAKRATDSLRWSLRRPKPIIHHLNFVIFMIKPVKKH